jgi:hypothetical protein
MPIVPFKPAASIAELAAQIYNLSAGSPVTATAQKALLAANPNLSGNLASIAPGTPIVAPAVAGTPPPANSIDPHFQALMGVLAKLQQSAQHASNAQLTGSAAKAPEKPNPKRTAALETLASDIQIFTSLRSS